MKIVWKIEDMERLKSNDYVVNVHYRVFAEEENHKAEIYGTISYQYEDGETFIPYENLSEEIVIGWVQESDNKQYVEDKLQSKINLLKNPEKINGRPWDKL